MLLYRHPWGYYGPQVPARWIYRVPTCHIHYLSPCILCLPPSSHSASASHPLPIKLPHSDILAPPMQIMPLQQAAKTEIVLGNDLFEIESRLAPLHFPRFGQFAAIWAAPRGRLLPAVKKWYFGHWKEVDCRGSGGERGGEGAAGFGVHSPAAASDHEKFPGFPHNFYHGKWECWHMRRAMKIV